MKIDIKKFKSQLFLPFLDQGIVSLSNFLTSLFIIRFIGIEAFGVFSIAWLIVLFINSIQFSLISSPMMILGPKQKGADKEIYYGSILIHQLIFSMTISVVLWLILNNINLFELKYRISDIAMPLVIVVFFFQNQDFLRRFLFVENQYFFALLIDVVCYLGRVALLFLFLMNTDVNLVHVLWAIGFSSFVSIFLCIPKLRCLRFNFKYLILSFKDHWLIGRWLVGAAILRWTSGNYFIITTGVILGPVAVGTLKAAENILGILNIFLQGLENVIPSKASRHFHKGAIPDLIDYLFSVSIWGSVLILFIVSFIIVYASTIINVFYGKQFPGLENLLYLYSLCYLLTFLMLPLRSGLILFNKSKYILFATIITSIVALLTAKLFLDTFSIEGAVYGIIFTQLIAVGILSFYLCKEYRIRIKKNDSLILKEK